MSKGKALIDRVVDRAVEEAAIRAELEELKRQRRVAAGTLDFYRRYYAGEFKEEPEVAPGGDDDDGWDYEETEWDDD
jgi:hypothetical protein